MHIQIYRFQKPFAIGMSLLLIAALANGQIDSGSTGVTATSPLSADELHSLVAPIALYPDPLVAQILAAATFPDQVAIANYWLQEHKSLAGQTLMETVNEQSWDASVKALTQFPGVLNNMAKNLTWVSTLGEAYHNQPAEVMAAVQALRAQAKAQGHLQSGPQITVTQESAQTIVIEPTNPQVVYVPDYDPALVYGYPYVTPGYSAAAVATGALLGFGAGVALDAFGGCCGWGWGAWNANWYGGSVTYNRAAFYGNRAWHGGYYNGAYHAGYGYHNAYDRAAQNYRGEASRSANLDRAEQEASHRSSQSWARADNAFRSSNAFSGFGDRFGGGGWHSRAESFRGWGSMRAGGFGGGMFGGARFGGGHFGGFHGGFRR